MDERAKMIARAGEQGSDAGIRPDLYPRPKDDFQDVVDELERAFHGSHIADSFEQRAAASEDFIHHGLTLLPEEEKDYVEVTRNFLEKEVELPSIQLQSSLNQDKMQVYELRSKFRGGFTTTCQVQDLAFVYSDLMELGYRELVKKLAPTKFEVAKKLADNGILELKEEYRGGIVGQSMIRSRYERFRGPTAE